MTAGDWFVLWFVMAVIPFFGWMHRRDLARWKRQDDKSEGKRSEEQH